jgi:hypothetical protein
VTTRLRRIAPWLIVVILSFGLIACGGDDDDGNPAAASGSTGSTAAGSNSSSDGDTWKGKFETGTEVSLTLWVDAANDPDLAPFEAFRQAVGAGTVQYAKAVAKNTTSAPDSARFATLTDDSGEMFNETAIEVNFLCAEIADWIQAAPTQSTELVNQYSALLSGACEGNTLAGPTIAAGDTVTYYVAYEGDEPDFERVFMGAENELKR